MRGFYFILILCASTIQAQNFGKTKSYAAEFATAQTFDRDIFSAGKPGPRLQLNPRMSNLALPEMDSELITTFYGVSYYYHADAARMGSMYHGVDANKLPGPHPREYGQKSKGTWTSWLKKERIE